MILQSAPAMLNFLRLLLCLSLALLASTACRKTSTTRSSTVAAPDTLIPGNFITNGGVFIHDDGTFARELTVSTSSGAVSYKLGSTEKSGSSADLSGNSIRLSTSGDPWFVFVESPVSLWVFDGKDELFYDYQLSKVRYHGRQAIAGGRLLPDIPPVPHDLILRLPPELQRLFPDVVPAVKRPSL
jgi:hypothetical protein